MPIVYLIALLAFLPWQAQAACIGSDPYDCLTAYYGDTHNHPGNSLRWKQQEDIVDNNELADGCAHSYRTTATLCSQARTNGADFIFVTHHSQELAPSKGEGWNWFSGTDDDWVEPFYGGGTGDTIPRDTSGFLLEDSTFTYSELKWSCEQAYAESTDDFLCMCGIEYTTQGKGEGSCPATGSQDGRANCGGHKIALCSTALDTNCAAAVAGGVGPGGFSHLCGSEEALYEWANSNQCVVSTAHPCGANSPHVFLPFDGSRPGGLHPEIVAGIEVGGTGLACESGGNIDSAGRYIESWDFQLEHRPYLNLAPVSGKDTHMRPGVGGAGTGTWATNDCSAGTAAPFSGPHTGCWVAEFSRDGVLSALRARRCFWNVSDRAEIQFSMADENNGKRRVPMGGTLGVTDTDAYVVVEVDPDVLTITDIEVYEIYHGSRVVATCSYPCSIAELITIKPGAAYRARARNNSNGITLSAAIRVN